MSVFTYKSYNIIQFAENLFFTSYVSKIDGEIKEIRTNTIEEAKKRLDWLVFGIER